MRWSWSSWIPSPPAPTSSASASRRCISAASWRLTSCPPTAPRPMSSSGWTRMTTALWNGCPSTRMATPMASS